MRAYPDDRLVTKMRDREATSTPPCWLPWPSVENFIDYADLAHVASTGVVVGYLVAAPNVGKRDSASPCRWKHDENLSDIDEF